MATLLALYIAQELEDALPSDEGALLLMRIASDELRRQHDLISVLESKIAKEQENESI